MMLCFIYDIIIIIIFAIFSWYYYFSAILFLRKMILFIIYICHILLLFSRCYYSYTWRATPSSAPPYVDYYYYYESAASSVYIIIIRWWHTLFRRSPLTYCFMLSPLSHYAMPFTYIIISYFAASFFDDIWYIMILLFSLLRFFAFHLRCRAIYTLIFLRYAEKDIIFRDRYFSCARYFSLPRWWCRAAAAFYGVILKDDIAWGAKKKILYARCARNDMRFLFRAFFDIFFIFRLTLFIDICCYTMVSYLMIFVYRSMRRLSDAGVHIIS